MICDTCADAHSDLSSWPKGIHFKKSQTFAGTKLTLKLNRWLPINLVCNFQQTTQETWDSQDTHTLTHTHTLIHTYIHVCIAMYTKSVDSSGPTAFTFCTLFLLLLFVFWRWNYTVTANIDIHTEPCGRVEAPETRHQGLIVAARPPLCCRIAALSQTPLQTRPDAPLRSARAEPSRSELSATAKRNELNCIYTPN